MKGRNERYHDRVAARYDDIYKKDAYWEYYFDVGFRHMKSYLPRDLSAPILDAGCGSGLYGLALIRSGFRVVFSDLSQKMLDRARQNVETEYPGRPAEFVKADLSDLLGLADETFSLVCAQGDPLSFVQDVRRALQSIRRVLKPGGLAVCSVDSRFGGIDPFFSRDDLDGLSKFLDTGGAEWLAERAEERFPTHAFSPDELRKRGRDAGFETVHLIGKTVFDLRGNHAWLLDRTRRRQLLDLEVKYGDTELGLGRGHHLQVVWRKT